MAIIEVNNLTKEYKLGHLIGLRQNTMNVLKRLTGRPIHQRETFKALDNLNFSIDEGEVVGIIGHNGAGKSTLLKHLADISKPSSGHVKVNGSVAPLIEVGAGVNPELTGRENIFLNGAILGIPNKIIKSKLDEIIEFSELEQFIDTPVKRYSSGMTVKLGFSIATSMDADILIIDEVLAVGDLAFQRKCFDRMERLIKHQGKTVLIVSHNIRQIVRMCSRVIMLNQGSVEEDGDPNTVCDRFYAYSNDKIEAEKQKTLGQISSDSDICELVDIQQVAGEGDTHEIISGQELKVKVRLKINKTIRKPEIVIGTHTTDFVYLTGDSTSQNLTLDELQPGRYEFTCTWPSYPLRAGVYCFRVVVFNEIRGMLLSGEGLAMFKVLPALQEAHKPGLRLLDLPVNWAFETQSPDT
ncbi:MAG TPA: ATP-binding cassette domain-containing protein [Chromatiaceae bacterium]|jgi:ABC-type polysaccharide/polyol phosphate transport system ATPase subunit|nr:ATP-binding cassette domain-containing protein [Chromatiaceae bacterium]HIN82552.1 ATP-binding cassette domain-containing protein [Chromatiales bacterium]